MNESKRARKAKKVFLFGNLYFVAEKSLFKEGEIEKERELGIGFALPALSTKMPQIPGKRFFFAFVFLFWLVVWWVCGNPNNHNNSEHTTKQSKRGKRKPNNKRKGLSCCGARQAPHHPKPSKTQTKPKTNITHKNRQTNTQKKGKNKEITQKRGKLNKTST